MHRAGLWAAFALASLPGQALAFCGFYVGGADASLFNNATQVALMREGTRTVVSMQNDYQGPPEDFAMVVPVPVVLQKENVKTLDPGLFARLDRFTAPRLVEYHEANPCLSPREEEGYGYSFSDDPLSAGGFGPGDAAIRVRPSVRVMSRFSVGEYEVVILSADDSMGLDTWLRDKGYKIPAGAEPYLRPYVAAGDKFFVARVDSKAVSFNNGKARLSPLRFHYDSPVFSLPVRLGLINAKGPQDLIVYALGRGQRYEVANRDNVAAPTNLALKAEAKARFGAIYAGLFDQIQRERPGAVVTEYAWPVSSCDPCPTTPPEEADLAALGADVTKPLGDDEIFDGRVPGWVITRLHTRQDRKSATDDLVFREAPPLVGGRGTPDAKGALSQAVAASGGNEFQARYAVLYPWKGPVTCEKPSFRGWTGRPPQAAVDPGNTEPSKDLLSGLVVDQQKIDLMVLSGAQPVSSRPLPLRSGGGCAGCAVGGQNEAPSLLSLLGLAGAAALRRRRLRTRR